MEHKRRLSATVSEDLLRAGREAVRAGEVESLSAWVNRALARHAEHDRKLRALDEFLVAFDALHGPISEAEVRAAEQAADRRSVVIRSSVP